MNKTLVLFLAFVIVINACLGLSAAVAPDSNDPGNITISSYNQNLYSYYTKPTNPDDPGKTLPLQKTGLPIIPALLSALSISSSLIYERLKK
jgi:hypothetical protein